jgi:hypothetical protein
VTTDFPLVNARLVDLLGVRYFVVPEVGYNCDELVGRVAEDDAPGAYNFLLGMRDIGRQFLFENGNVLPRAFVVASAESQMIAEPDVLAQLNSIDVRRSATLEEWDLTSDPLPRGGGATGPGRILSHKPNEIRIALDGQSAGLLVLTDPWYPGWRCWVDGQETKIWKADYAFRGVMVPAGNKEVVFKFEPRSYRRGRIISLAALVGLVLFGVAILCRHFSTGRR